jgi:predicted nucleotidyltransferase
MSVVDRLRTRRSEHVALLKQLERVLQAEQRIVAAWLFGSEGRRSSDVLSDLDVWVIVKDEFSETISAERQRYAARLERPALLLVALSRWRCCVRLRGRWSN